MKGKDRLSASIDAGLLAAIEKAVAETGAPTVSAWVNEAIRQKLEHDRRLLALSSFIAEYEAEHGEITDAEIIKAKRRAHPRTKARSAGRR